MIIINAERRAGERRGRKTTRLIEISAEKGLLIDNLEIFLKHITGGNIKYTTATVEIRGIDETRYMDTL